MQDRLDGNRHAQQVTLTLARHAEPGPAEVYVENVASWARKGLFGAKA